MTRYYAAFRKYCRGEGDITGFLGDSPWKCRGDSEPREPPSKIRGNGLPDTLSVNGAIGKMVERRFEDSNGTATPCPARRLCSRAERGPDTQSEVPSADAG
jgi:hypothetical protein